VPLHHHYDVFISYARTDSQRVRPLVDELRRRGYRVFFDLESIEVGDRWKLRLEKSVRTSRTLVLCWSANAKTSEYVQFEYSKAEGIGKRVMPWLLDRTPLPAMVEIQGTAEDNPAAVATALANQLGWPLTRRRLLASSVLALASAGGWLTWYRRGFIFEGVVTDYDQRPLGGVLVTVEETIPVSVETDSRGAFHVWLRGSQPQWVKARFTRPGYREETLNAQTGAPFTMSLRRVGEAK
jgi:hypothetical protein